MLSVRAPACEPFMTPKELRSIMWRTRASSLMLSKELGIASQQIRKWRSGTRPIPQHHLDRLEAFFRERGAMPPETPRLIDPRDVATEPIQHRITIERR